MPLAPDRGRRPPESQVQKRHGPKCGPMNPAKTSTKHPLEGCSPRSQLRRTIGSNTLQAGGRLHQFLHLRSHHPTQVFLCQLAAVHFRCADANRRRFHRSSLGTIIERHGASVVDGRCRGATGGQFRYLPRLHRLHSCLPQSGSDPAIGDHLVRTSQSTWSRSRMMDTGTPVRPAVLMVSPRPQMNITCDQVPARGRAPGVPGHRPFPG